MVRPPLARRIANAGAAVLRHHRRCHLRPAEDGRVADETVLLLRHHAGAPGEFRVVFSRRLDEIGAVRHIGIRWHDAGRRAEDDEHG